MHEKANVQCNAIQYGASHPLKKYNFLAIYSMKTGQSNTGIKSKQK